MLSFDVTDRQIRIVRGSESGGKVRVSAATTVEVTEDLIINGHIKNVPQMATIINDELKERRMGDKEAVVSISSNLIIFKELHIPKTKGAQLLNMVRNQMQHTMGISDDYSISYTIAGEVVEDGVQALKVLATACPFEVVDCFRKMFSMLGISLKSVAVSCNTISRIILSDNKSRAKMPLLLVQIDPMFVSLNLYENGQLTFSRFASIDPADYDNAEDYVYEAVNENIFRMFQFQKSRGGSEMIQNVVFYGDTSEYIRFTNALEQMEISTSLLGVPNSVGGYENFEFQVYANAIGAMFRSNKESEYINLLEADAKSGRGGSSSAFVFAAIASFAIPALIVAAVFIVLNININSIKAETQTIRDWMASEETLEQIRKVDETQAKSEKISAYSDHLNFVYGAYERLPVFNEEIYDLISENFMGTDAISTALAYSEGHFSYTCSSASVTDPARVAENFYNQSAFTNIAYNGYSLDSQNQTGDEISAEKIYSFQMSFAIPVEEIPEETPEEVSDTEGGAE